MSSPIQTEFPIEIGGRNLVLSYPMRAIWAFEDAAHVDIFSDEDSPENQEQAVAQFNERIFGKTKRDRMQRTALLFWAGLITKHPEITREQAESMVFVRNLLTVQKSVLEALSAALSSDAPREESEENPQKAKESVVA